MIENIEARTVFSGLVVNGISATLQQPRACMLQDHNHVCDHKDNRVLNQSHVHGKNMSRYADTLSNYSSSTDSSSAKESQGQQ